MTKRTITITGLPGGAVVVNGPRRRRIKAPSVDIFVGEVTSGLHVSLHRAPDGAWTSVVSQMDGPTPVPWPVRITHAGPSAATLVIRCPATAPVSWSVRPDRHPEDITRSPRGRPSAPAVATLPHVLATVFDEATEVSQRETALNEVGSLVRRDASMPVLSLIMNTLCVNAGRDLVTPRVLYQIHENCDSDTLRAASLLRLARRAYEAKSLETLACALSLLANRPWTLVKVKKEWVETALEADRAAGYSCRARTLGDILAAWPSKDALSAITKMHPPECDCS